MTPERRARIIAGVLIGLAILQLIPILPTAFDFLKVRIEQDFLHEGQQ
ncbi:hypothetical protein LEP3755_43070 [Leptolyngbya sp. NIES-3755]|nr:hypothetical protein LEP3755_43070 [Leptolyngbya sp. NIES-3755]